MITYGVDSLGRPQSAVDQGNNINYALNASYAAQGDLASVTNGQTSLFNGITYSVGYNNRLWPATFSASSSNGTALNLSYAYFPNGNVETRTNNLDTGRTLNYAYDALNRVISGKTQATSGGDCWGQTVPSSGYDQYGNLSIINVSQCSAPALDLSINTAKNQINSSGFSYDNTGNMTGDGSYSYVWNGAGMLKSAGGVTYTYDGNYNRVEKSSGTLYWRGLGGNVLAETDTSGNTLAEYVYFDGSRIARRDASGNVYYYFPDTLGSEVSITNATGVRCYDADFYLFGGEKMFTNNCPPSYKFAGMERDSETGLDHTLNRQYSSQFGRWMTPDPAGLAAADPANPQSWNRYAYVMNNPTTYSDPLGLLGPNDCVSTAACTITVNGGAAPQISPILELLMDENISIPNSQLPPQLPLPIFPNPWELIPLGGQSQSNGCTEPILSAVNNQFDANLSPDNVVLGFTPRGGAANLNIAAGGLPPAQFNAIQTGRYPLNWWSYVIGYGPTLHVTGRTYFDPAPAIFRNLNVSGATAVLFTAHIDTAFAYNPIGFLIHFLIDVLHTGGPRSQCPQG